MLDFLKEIVESVLDPSAGGTVGLETEGAEAKKKRGKGKKGVAAAGGEAGEGSTAPKRKRKPKKGKDEEVKEEEGKERDENGDMEMGGKEGSMYYRPKSLVGGDEEDTVGSTYTQQRCDITDSGFSALGCGAHAQV
jgi:hypothetical protein